ncbi:hypothetical protein ACIBQ5_36655 [Streptomyces massasporeus]|uniref:hypothetical protein n=1 Tax=Streptomyces massasporeus TaxID=67324 RepID=UPI0037BE1319
MPTAHATPHELVADTGPRAGSTAMPSMTTGAHLSDEERTTDAQQDIAFRRAHVLAWAASGMSLANYAASKKFPRSTLYTWIHYKRRSIGATDRENELLQSAVDGQSQNQPRLSETDIAELRISAYNAARLARLPDNNWTPEAQFANSSSLRGSAEKLAEKLAAYRKYHVLAWATSGQSIRSYTAGRNFSATTLWYWTSGDVGKASLTPRAMELVTKARTGHALWADELQVLAPHVEAARREALLLNVDLQQGPPRRPGGEIPVGREEARERPEVASRRAHLLAWAVSGMTRAKYAEAAQISPDELRNWGHGRSETGMNGRERELAGKAVKAASYNNKYSFPDDQATELRQATHAAATLALQGNRDPGPAVWAQAVAPAEPGPQPSTAVPRFPSPPAPTYSAHTSGRGADGGYFPVAGQARPGQPVPPPDTRMSSSIGHALGDFGAYRVIAPSDTRAASSGAATLTDAERRFFAEQARQAARHRAEREGRLRAAAAGAASGALPWAQGTPSTGVPQDYSGLSHSQSPAPRR